MCQITYHHYTCGHGEWCSTMRKCPGRILPSLTDLALEVACPGFEAICEDAPYDRACDECLEVYRLEGKMEGDVVGVGEEDLKARTRDWKRFGWDAGDGGEDEDGDEEEGVVVLRFVEWDGGEFD